MQKKKGLATVYRQDMIADDIFDMWLETDLAKGAHPGQFISVYPHNKSTILPRPISICEVNEEKTMLRLVYRKVGQGTTEFSNYQAGTQVEILGVLGNGFPVEKAANKHVFLIGGGIGIPPMLQTAKELKASGIAAKIDVIVGYRNELFLYEDFKQYADVTVATEDGSFGTKGTVIDAIKENALEGDILMACGPMPMLRALKSFAKERGMEAYISLEERMACGVGACLGCVCKTKEVDAHSHVHNARICTDGPVYDAEEVEI